jgi:hypothetical protein
VNRFIFFVICIFPISLLAQEKTGIAIDPSARNIAALFTMTDENGRLKNLDLMESVFKDGSLGFTYQRHHNVSAEYIYDKLESLAAELDEDATLLLYFNSHGGGSWDRFAMTSKGGNFKFRKALESLGKSGKKIKRLIFLVDTCHAEGSIQDSTGEDGKLLKQIKSAKPTDFLPVLPDKYEYKLRPFTSVFLDLSETDGSRGTKIISIIPEIDYGENLGVYEQILIISSSSVEDLSIRGVFASRFASAFKEAKGNNSMTVAQFLKRFAESHGSSGQQPHYKILPDENMLSELLFGPWPAQTIPIRDAVTGKQKKDINLIPVPSK